MFGKSILGGILIGLGGLGYVLSGENKICGSVMYIFSFLAILYTESNLFTEKAGSLGDRIRWKDLLWILLGNVLGAGFIALFSRWEGLGAVDLAATYLTGQIESIPFLRGFCRACICGLILDTAFWIFREKESIIPVIFAAPLIIFLGQLHSIAGSYYILLAGNFSWRILLLWVIVVLGNFIGCNLRRMFMPAKKR